MKHDGGLIWTHNKKENVLTAYSPDGKNLRQVKLPAVLEFIGLTPDGSRIMFVGRKGKATEKWWKGLTLHVGEIDESGKGTDTGLGWREYDWFGMSPDGKQVVRARHEGAFAAPPGGRGNLWRYSHVLYDFGTKKERPLDLPEEGCRLVQWSADGKTWRVIEEHRGEVPGVPNSRWMTTPAGEKTDLKPLCDAASLQWLDPHPDGETLLGAGTIVTPKNEPASFGLFRVTGGKAEALVKFDGQASGVAFWSPDGKRIACMKEVYDPKTSKLRDMALLLFNADGTGEKELFRIETEERHTRLLGWFPTPQAKSDEPKAKPPAREPIRAPVPKAKENTMGLTASVTPEKVAFLLGEPVFMTFTVHNPTGTPWQFEEGGDYRNRLWRPNSFTISVTDADGKAVPQPDSGFDMGGMSHLLKLPAGGEVAFKRELFLPHWATITKPGEYTISVTRAVGLVPADAEEPFEAKATPVTLRTFVKVTVQPADAKKLGVLIEEWAAGMLDPKASTPNPATQRLQEIQDERVIPHFVELGKRPGWSPRHTACGVLKKFKTDEAFAALMVIATTTADDLTASGKRQQDESDAASARGSAVSALAACGHPDALAEVWKAAGDDSDRVRMAVLHKAYEVKSAEARKVIEKMTDDPDERVRAEAKRYAGLLAKEKK